MKAPWLAGPHAGFELADVPRLARESISWFESGAEASPWRGNPSARLGLVYPTASGRAVVRRDTSTGLSWEGELRTWFEHVPPGTAPESEPAPEAYSWKIDIGTGSSLSGSAEGPEQAVARMRTVDATLPSGPPFQGRVFQLEATVQRAPRQRDCFSVSAERVSELDQLPRQLSEKRLRWGR
jgi:hypothetical protein